jgi:hypothetical protein
MRSSVVDLQHAVQSASSSCTEANSIRELGEIGGPNGVLGFVQQLPLLHKDLDRFGEEGQAIL